MKRILLLVIFALCCGPVHAASQIDIGSKKFTESYVLGDIAATLLTRAGFSVNHHQGMGGTIILWQALRGGAIAAYPEYTGTISEEILKHPGAMTPAQMRDALAPLGIGMTGELGFNNTYALVMRRDRAARMGIAKISDLKSHPELAFGLTHEFLGRKDGWVPLCARYGLAIKDVRGIDHALGYAALDKGEIDVKDAYSTDARIASDDLVVLRDDLDFFPSYRAVFLYRLDTPPAAVAALRKMEGTLDETKMTRLNAEAEKDKSYARAASLYFAPQSGGGATTSVAATNVSSEEPLAPMLWRLTLRHVMLVAIALLLSIAAGLPLGIRAARPGVGSTLILGAVGVLQTIPSLALLALLVPVPWLGISGRTAIVALFLYGLLPIVRNTATGLQSISPALRESAAALGLSPAARLRLVFLPLAAPTILAGIKTSAVISVGTATIAALIGAGGLGEPILSGLNLNDNALILQGAIPAALLAIAVQLAFEGLDRLLIPKGLRPGLRGQ